MVKSIILTIYCFYLKKTSFKKIQRLTRKTIYVILEKKGIKKHKDNIKNIYNELYFLSPIGLLLDDKSINEIKINNFYKLQVSQK